MKFYTITASFLFLANLLVGQVLPKNSWVPIMPDPYVSLLGANPEDVSPETPQSSQAFLENMSIYAGRANKSSPMLSKDLPMHVDLLVEMSLIRTKPNFFPGDIFQPLAPGNLFTISKNALDDLSQNSEVIQAETVHLYLTLDSEAENYIHYRSEQGLTENVPEGEIGLIAIVGVDGFTNDTENLKEHLERLKSEDGSYYFIQLSTTKADPPVFTVSPSVFILKK